MTQTTDNPDAQEAPSEHQLNYIETPAQYRSLYIQTNAWFPLAFFLCITAAVGPVFRFNPWLALIIWLVPAWFFRGVFFQVKRFFFGKDISFDLLFDFEKGGLGYRIDGGERWWVFLDGIVGFELLDDLYWDIQHHNGTRFFIPKELVSDELATKLQEAKEFSQSPAAFAQAIERGERMLEHSHASQGMVSVSDEEQAGHLSRERDAQ